MSKLPDHLYRNFFYSSNDIIFTLDPELNFLDANKKAVETYGYTLEEFRKMNVNDLSDKSARMNLDTLKEQFYNIDGRIFEAIHKDKQGNIFPVEVSSVRIDIQGTFLIQGFVRVVKNREDAELALKLSETKFRTLAENINDAILVRKKDECIFANSAFTEVWGLSLDEIAKEPKAYLKLIYPEDLEQLIYNHKISDYEETGELNEELRINKPDGSLRWIWLRSFPQLIEVDPVPRVIVLATDITEKRELTAGLFAKIIEIEENHKSKLSKELHDGIGPVLSTIRMHLNLLQKKIPDQPEVKKLLQGAMELTDQVIITSRSISHELSSAALNDFGLEAALTGYLNKMKEVSGIEINFNVRLLTDRFDGTIEKSLFRICQELVNNGMKHSGAGRMDVSLMQDSRMLLLYYSDNGKGFEMQETIQKSQSGQGLLNITNRVKAMNGTYEIHSKPGKGTRVIISLQTKTS